jgi:lipoprotein NlpI
LRAYRNVVALAALVLIAVPGGVAQAGQCDMPSAAAVRAIPVAAPAAEPSTLAEQHARARELIARGNYLDDTGHPHEALAAYSAAIQLGLVAEAKLERAMTLAYLENFSAALDDLADVARRTPRNPAVFANRAHVCFFIADFAAVVQNVGRALDLGSHNPYLPLLRYIARRRLGQQGAAELAAASLGLARNAWPGAAVSLLLGEIDEAALRHVVAQDGGMQARCEAPFYIGQNLLLAGDVSGARRAFQEMQAVQLCRATTEYHAARFELRHLGPQP